MVSDEEIADELWKRRKPESSGGFSISFEDVAQVMQDKRGISKEETYNELKRMAEEKED